jgi:hypothetical protein
MSVTPNLLRGERAMTPVRFFAVCAVVLALGCSKDKTFMEPAPPLAAITWANIVPDTGQLDMRVVDIVSNAGFFHAGFRTALTFPQSIEAGQREIRVFLTSTDPTIAQTVFLDTTFTFAQNSSYGFYIGGFARTGQAPARRAVITTANLPTLGPTKFAVRIINLSPSLAGAVPALPDTTVAPDAFVRRIGTLPSGAPDGGNLGFGGTSSYVVLDTGRYAVTLTPTGTTGPAILLASLPPGAPASSTMGPLAGSLTPGTVLTGVITPRSVIGSVTPQGGKPSAKAVEVVTLSTDTVTVQSGSMTIVTNRAGGKADTTLTSRNTGTAASTGVNAGDVVLVSGTTQPEYTGWQVAMAVADSLSCNPTNPADTPTKCAAANDTATTRFRFRYRIVGTPVSPATGTTQYRIYPPGYAAADFTVPFVTWVVDKRP